MFHRMLVCAFSFSPARIQSLYVSLMRFPLTLGRQRRLQPKGSLSISPRAMKTLRCGIPPTWSPYSAVRFSSLRALPNFPRSYWHFSTQKYCHKLTKSFPCQIKHSGVKDKHPEETWSILNKPMVKQARQGLHNYFHSQRNIHVFIPSLSIPITSYRFCLITSDTSNTRFHCTSVFTFMKGNIDNPPSPTTVGSPPKPQ